VTFETVGFWVVAAVLLASSLAVVLTPNLFHAVLYLAAALVATGVIFLLLDQPFLFAVQLLLYAGGVVTHPADESSSDQRRDRRGGGLRRHHGIPAQGAARDPAARTGR